MRRNQHQSGFVLVAVLVVIMLASMVVVSLMFQLGADETASAAATGSEQAWTAALSGINEALRVASQAVPGSTDWQNDPTTFHERLVLDDGSESWYFTVFSMKESDDQGVRYGLADEAGKLNLNNATESMLGKLPRMTPYLAQGLLDFMDADDTPRPEGAEQEYYDTLAKPYAVLNGPLATVDQLLLVRGFTPLLLYGEDANLNFQLDANEDDGQEGQFPPDNKDGKLDSGLRPWLTVSSYDLNQDNAGVRRTDLNDPAHVFPEKDFPAALVSYVAALRRNKIKLTNAVDLLEAKGTFKDEKGQAADLTSGIGKEELAAVLDRFTATPDERLPGLINVNTAPVAVLQTLPDVDEALAESIVAARRYLRPEQQQTPAWLFEEGIVSADLFKKLAPKLTARARQFHFHAVGYGVPSGRYRVLEVVIDAAGSKPAIVYLRDITRLGLPFKIEPPKSATNS